MYITKKMWEENVSSNLIQYDTEFATCRFCYGGAYYRKDIILISFYNNMAIKYKKVTSDFTEFYNLFAEEIDDFKKGKSC